MVGIQERQELSVDDAERMVDVARLGVLVRRPGQVPGTERGSQLGDFRPPAVIEDPGLMRRLERDRRGDGRHQDLRPFVEGRNEHGDTGDPTQAVAARPDVDVPQAEGEQGEADAGVDLEGEHRDREEPGVGVHR